MLYASVSPLVNICNKVATLGWNQLWTNKRGSKIYVYNIIEETKELRGGGKERKMEWFLKREQSRYFILLCIEHP